MKEYFLVFSQQLILHKILQEIIKLILVVENGQIIMANMHLLALI